MIKVNNLKKSFFFVFMLTMFSVAQSINVMKTYDAVAFFEHSLDISYYIAYTTWGRNPETDLPRCYSNVNVIIFNQGAEAENAHLTVILDESSFVVDRERLVYGSNIITGICITDEYEDFGVNHPLKYYITAKTGTGFTYGHSEYIWKTTFPRWLDDKVASFYITPNNPKVKELAREIATFPYWLTLNDWVYFNIKYEYDSEKYGVPEYWQLPHETIDLKTGDCEDKAILLCSLLRAVGYDENSVFVILGYAETTGHAWVRVNIGGIWTDLDPTNDPTGIIGGLISLAVYGEAYQFNDVYFTKLK